MDALFKAKPPISKAKMSSITKAAMKTIKMYKHVVQTVEKFITKVRHLTYLNKVRACCDDSIRYAFVREVSMSHYRIDCVIFLKIKMSGDFAQKCSERAYLYGGILTV